MLFFGRFHPLLVHFPIALLLLAFLFEVLSRTKPFQQLRYSVVPILWIGTGAALVSCVTGFWLSSEGGYDDSALGNHQWAGIITAISSAVVLWVKVKIEKKDQTKHSVSVILLFTLLTIALVVAGHLGANLTHGEEFLVEHAPWNTERNEFADLVPAVENIEDAVYYPEVIYPILARKCYSCHSAKRQKGDLRLDTEEFLRSGGKSGSLLTAALTDSTMLCKRIMLPVDHKKHMPPNEREQLTSAEIALIQAWVADGASMDKRVSAMANADEVMVFWNAFESMQQRKSWFPQIPVSPASDATMASLREKGLLVLPIAEGSPYLIVSCIRPDSIGNEMLSMLGFVREQLLILKLERTKVSDEGMKALSGLENLRSLHLAYTSIGDEGIKALRSLAELRYLNLVGTDISDQALETLSTLEKLEELYVFQTRVTPSGIESFNRKVPAAQIDTGNYYLPARVTDTLVYTRRQ